MGSERYDNVSPAASGAGRVVSHKTLVSVVKPGSAASADDDAPLERVVEATRQTGERGQIRSQGSTIKAKATDAKVHFRRMFGSPSQDPGTADTGEEVEKSLPAAQNDTAADEIAAMVLERNAATAKASKYKKMATKAVEEKKALTQQVAFLQRQLEQSTQYSASLEEEVAALAAALEESQNARKYLQFQHKFSGKLKMAEARVLRLASQTAGQVMQNDWTPAGASESSTISVRLPATHQEAGRSDLDNRRHTTGSLGSASTMDVDYLAEGASSSSDASAMMRSEGHVSRSGTTSNLQAVIESLEDNTSARGRPPGHPETPRTTSKEDSGAKLRHFSKPSSRRAADRMALGLPALPRG